MLQSETVIAVTPTGASGKWIGRDNFIADAAVQIDRLNATVARLERELEKSRTTVAEMAEESSRTRRFQAFETSLENSRDYKLTDVQRSCRDLKGRLDAIEGDRSTFAGLTYKTFEAVDRKLAELSALQTCLAGAEAAARRNEALFFGALAVAAASLASRFLF